MWGAKTSVECERVEARRHDDDVLLAIRHVGHGRRVSLRIEAALPQRPAGAGLEGAKPLVVGAGDEDQSASGGNGSALAEGAGVFHALRFKVVVRAEGDAPGDVAGV